MKKIVAFGFALLMIFAVFVPFVSAINDPTKEGYQSAVNPNVLGEKTPATTGHIDVLLRCRSPEIGGEFSVSPVVVSAVFGNGDRVDKGFVDQYVKVLGKVEVKKFLPDGTFDTEAEPGTYLLAMQDGNGGQPEYALAAVKAGQTVTVLFLGHGITPAEMPKEEALPEIKVLTATYGMTKLVCVPGTPAVTHTETVVDVAAYDETVIDSPAVPGVPAVPAVPAVTHVVHHAAVTHQVTVVDTPEQPAVPDTYALVSSGTFTGYCKETSGTYDFAIGSKHYRIGSGMGYYQKYLKTLGHAAIPAVTHTETVVDVAAYDETVIDSPAVPEVPAVPAVPAVTHVVHHAAQTHTITVVDVPATHTTCHLEGCFVNVKAKVQAAVDAGERTFKFDNAQNPGGLFDGENNLLAAINDPAPGQVKKFVITYKVNGHIKVASGDEYEEFTLG
jgi:hypothetical protein